MTPLLYAALLALPHCGQAGESPVRWQTDYNAAIREARDAGKPLLLDVGTAGCSWCRKLEAGPLQDAAVVRELGRFVCCKVDAGAWPNVTRQYGVRSYPTLLIVHVAGAAPTRRQAGYLDAPALARWLRD